MRGLELAVETVEKRMQFFIQEQTQYGMDYQHEIDLCQELIDELNQKIYHRQEDE